MLWNNVEYNICNFNFEEFIQLKKIFGISLLNELKEAFYDASNSFISNIENEIPKWKEKFKFKENSYFLSFNFTSTLEIVYHIPRDRIIYIHNSTEEIVMNNFFGVSKDSVILGHANNFELFAYNQELYEIDKDYFDFVKGTVKDTKKMIKDLNLESK